MSHLLLAALAAPIITGCSTVKVTESKTFTSAPAPRPATIYIANFDSGPITNEITSVAGTSAMVQGCPDELHAKLADLMAESLVQGLTKAGYQAVRISPGTPPSCEGWLVQGSFTSVEKGKLALRALVGLGAGREDVQVVCVVDCLSETKPEPLYEVHTEARSGKLPGAVIGPPMLAPVRVVIRFVSCKKDLEEDVKKTAAQIATQIGQQLQGQRPNAYRSSHAVEEGRLNKPMGVL